ncbi:alpha/beta fold hydrolase [Streptomyces sp. NPDC005760]|uniref:alpha/beta fold hydrolase n=1 Tax=Streptomyces sp. NPDC005760 TaxID=3156718 RepID=UPI0033DBB145
MLGGAFMDMYGWRRIERHLTALTTIITIDLPGQGSAEQLDDTTLTGYTAQWQALADALDQLGLDRVDLLGYCYGATLACGFAAHHPERISRLALTGVSDTLQTATVAEWARLTEQHRMPELGRSLIARAMAGPAIPIDGRDDIAARLMRHYASVPPHSHVAATLRRILNAHTQAMDLTGSLPHQLLVLSGAHDPFTPPDQARTFAARHPHATTATLPRTDHLAYLERSDAFSTYLARHLRLGAHRVP